MIFRQNTGLPPGGLIFKDPRSGKVWDDTSAFMDDRITEVIKFRMQNPSIYSPVNDTQFLDRKNVEQEITDQNYARLGPSSVYFLDPPTRTIPGPSTHTAGRCSCGVDLEPRYCPTCQGRKVIGYRCPKCNQIYESN